MPLPNEPSNQGAFADIHYMKHECRYITDKRYTTTLSVLAWQGTSNKKEIMGLLYQENPFVKSSYWAKIPESYTDSIQSYRKMASDMSWVLENNCRTPNHEIVLRYFHVLTPDELKARWKRIQPNLKKAKITFIASLELTRGKNNRPNDRVHYHFLIDSGLSREELKETMKAVCHKSNIGVYREDYDLVFPNEGITEFDKRKIDYFTKCGRKHKVYLFKKHLGLRKFYYSWDWFVDENGNRTTRPKILERLRKEYAEKMRRASSCKELLLNEEQSTHPFPSSESWETGFRKEDCVLPVEPSFLHEENWKLQDCILPADPSFWYEGDWRQGQRTYLLLFSSLRRDSHDQFD